MTNKKAFLGMLVMALAFGMAVVGCDDDSNPTFNNDAGPFAGTWTGTVMGATATVVISNSGWTLSIPSLPTDTGNFNRNGNSASLYNSSNINIGIANIVNNNIIQLILNNDSGISGTYMLTRVPNGGQGGSGYSVPDSVFGVWTGSIGNRSRMLTLTRPNNWSLVPDGESGLFTMTSNDTVSLVMNVIHIGDAKILSDTEINVTLNNAVSVSDRGTWPFTLYD